MYNTDLVGMKYDVKYGVNGIMCESAILTVVVYETLSQTSSGCVLWCI